MSEQYIEIVGGNVQFVNKSVEREIPVEQFLAHLELTMSVDTGILPKNCFYMMREEDRFLYAVELPASVKKVVWLNKQTGERTVHMISIPYTQFYIQAKNNGMIGNMYLSCTKQPITNLNDPLFVAPYPNIHDSGTGRVCTGSMRVPQNAPLGAKINSIVSTFFEADFNRDLSPQVLSCIAGEVGSDREKYIPAWEAKTREDRFFSISDAVVYQELGTNVQDLVKRLVRF